MKRGAATEADGEIEEVDNGDDEDSSDLIIVLQQNTVACIAVVNPLPVPHGCKRNKGGHVKVPSATVVD